MPHHFLVLGATGPSGIAFLETALTLNHTLTIYARNPSKLPQHIQNLALQSQSSSSSAPQVQIFQGEFTSSSDSKSALTQAICSGATHLISFAGPAIPARGTPISKFYDNVLYPLLRQLSSSSSSPSPGEQQNRNGGNTNEHEEKPPRSRIKRIMVLSTPSFRVPEDKWSLKWFFGVQFVYWFFGDAWEEVNEIGNVTTALTSTSSPPPSSTSSPSPSNDTTSAEDSSGGAPLEWTIFRVPGLTNGSAGPVRAGFIGERGDGMLLSRKGMAVWVLGEVEERRWVGGGPAISDAGGWV